MKLIVQYRQNAAECRALAARMRTSGERDQLLRTAAQWEELAINREQSIRSGGLEPERPDET